MNCFNCFSSSHERKSTKQYENVARTPNPGSSRPMQPPRQPHPTHNSHHNHHQHSPQTKKPSGNVEKDRKSSGEIVNMNPDNKEGSNNIGAQTFTFRELATATKNFRQECLLGEGGFGRVYKGHLEKTGQEVAVKQLDRNGLQGNREFLVEVLMLSLLHHKNLVNLIGYCSDGEQRLLVYEFMARGSLEDHLLDIPRTQLPLDWNTRMKIALQAAKGLEYLHYKANPPVIYRDLKSSNILLDKEFNAKLSDFGLAKLGPVGDRSHVSSRVMGTYGYCAPEYQRTGQLTVKSDVYSFGVVFLELITGKRAIDTVRPPHEQNLVHWAEPRFREQKRYDELADPLLGGEYPRKGLHQAVAVAAMCLNEDVTIRPVISDVVTALSYLGDEPPELAEEEDDIEEEEKVEADEAEVSGAASSPPPVPKAVDLERQKMIAEAMEWGSNSRDCNARSHVSQGSSV